MLTPWDEMFPDLAVARANADESRGQSKETDARRLKTTSFRATSDDGTAPENVATSISTIIKALKHLALPDQCVALWIKGAQDDIEARTPNRTGYFTDPEALAREAIKHSGKAIGCHITVNPVDRDALKPSVLRMAFNRLSLYGPPTESAIRQRRWLLIDIDPKRPKDTCATNGEKKLALATARRVRTCLAGKGWPEPLMIDSGNGCYLLYAIELPAHDDHLVHRVLTAISEQCKGDGATIDTKVGPAKQLMRLPGTMNCKGIATAERPHRVSKILKVPTTRTIVSKEMLEAIASEAIPEPTPPKAESLLDMEDVRASLDRLPVAVQGENGSLAAIRAARRIVVAYDVPWDSPEAWELLKYYNTRCRPPWNINDLQESEDLRRKLREAHSRAAFNNESRGYFRRHGQGRFYEPLEGPAFPMAIPDYDWMAFDTPATVLDDPPVPFAYGLVMLTVLQSNRSTVLVPDVLIKRAHWGVRAPQHWRKRYREAIRAASREGYLVREIAACTRECAIRGVPLRHKHYKFSVVSCGALNELMDDDGVGFVTDDEEWKAWQKAGKVFRGYWPALVFGTSQPVGLTNQQVRLFMAITRELTRLAPKATGKRSPKGKRIYRRPFSDRPDRAWVMHGNMVHNTSRDAGMIACPVLPPGDHVGFNGNLRRCRGSGYALDTWARRGGYGKALTKGVVSMFLADLACLSEMFELMVVGRNQRTRQWYALDEMRNLANTRWGFVQLLLCTIRIYAPADFLTLWRYTLAKKLGFSWIYGGADCPFVIEDEVFGEVNNSHELLEWLKAHKVTRTEFAKRARISRRTLYRSIVRRIRSTTKLWRKVNKAIEAWDIVDAS